MMKRLISMIVLLGALIAQPATAQSAAAKPAVSAETDLLCAVWAADAATRAKTEKEKLGLTLLMTYFMGRWEGASGLSIETGFTTEFVTGSIAKLPGVNLECLNRAGEFGRQLQISGQRLQNSGSAK